MENQTVIALIATRSISLAYGLSALLKALPQIDEVTITRDFEIALQQIEAHKPRIVLLDFVLLGNRPEASLEIINSLVPGTQRVLLVDDVKEVNLVPNYAEAILIKGIAPSSIAAIVTNLLIPKGDKK
jgi:DNA-binding NarL/FixJ family response regulator